uniref:Ig-like domain-containing protein n=1 Tax=Trichuris muris TaxID=70415 RepID=A0A5S6QLE9_TRIMR
MRMLNCPSWMSLFLLAIFNGIHYRAHAKEKPYFDPATDTEVTIPATGPAYLHCAVHNLGSVEIAWIRQRDRQVISVQESMVINDHRFQMLHRKNSNDWCLIINQSNLNDSGAYECLLSTDPPLRHVTRLHVVENNSSISGTSHVEVGDTIVVRCAVKLKVRAGRLPSVILWHVNDTLISFKKNMKYNRYATTSRTALISELRVRAATLSDSGIYTCTCENAPVRKFQVTVEEYGWNWTNLPTISHRNSGFMLSYHKSLNAILIIQILFLN